MRRIAWVYFREGWLCQFYPLLARVGGGGKLIDEYLLLAGVLHAPRRRGRGRR